MALLDLLGRRWALRVIWELRDDAVTFRELRERTDGVSSSVLNDRLAELRSAGVAEHAAGGYRLTDEGRRLLALYAPLEEWAQRWAERERSASAGASSHFEVARDDVRRTRWVEVAQPALEDGEVLLVVERFGITANNATYALVGDRIGYWAFFPAEDGWGRVPAWGFARVVATCSDVLAVGDRVFGFVPMASHLVLVPRAAGADVVDDAPHRAEVPSAYNLYRRVGAGPADGEPLELLLRPLFVLAFFLDDLLAEEEQMGATEVWLSSASSKTTLATAFLLAGRGVRVVGLTSTGNRAWVEQLAIYDRVAIYDELETLGAPTTVYVDVAGDLGLRRRVHEHLGDRLRHSAVVGSTHADAAAVAGAADPDLPGPPPTFFFVPDRLRARTRELGRDEVERRMEAAGRELFDWVEGWLSVRSGSGSDAVRAAWLRVVAGEVPPGEAHVVSVAA